MTAVPDTGYSPEGEAGSGWSAAVSFASAALHHLGRDQRDAETLLRERGLVATGVINSSGARSANGSCRLVRSSDAWVAINLPRPGDLELLPAWLGLPEVLDTDLTVPWEEIAGVIADRQSDAVVSSGQELGLAVAQVPISATAHVDLQLEHRGTVDPSRPYVATAIGGTVGARSLAGLRVIDLSSLWAGPLCSRLLAEAGAEVIKVESVSRPDGTRLGDPQLFDRLHVGKELVQVPFEAGASGASLRALLAEADVIIEGSRPRALDRLGIDPAEVLAARPGRVWLSITAYGRTGPWCNRVGFGDDAAAAAGLLDGLEVDTPRFVGDAIADPLTGLLAAALVADAVATGGGMLIDLALREVARSAALRAEVQLGAIQLGAVSR